MKQLFSLLILLVCLNGALAQEATMSNDDVVALVKAGRSTTLIISMIRSSKPKFDTSTSAIIALGKSGVPDEVITAMVETKGGYSETPPPARSAEPAGASDSTKGLSGEEATILKQVEEPGIYLYHDGKLTMIEPSVYSGTKGSFLGTALTYGIKKSRMRAILRERRQILR